MSGAAHTLRRATPGASSLPDEEVVARVVAGDHGLFEILMRRYNQRLFRVARGIVGDDAEAEDVLQEAWVRAFHGLDGYRGEAAVATWLSRIAAYEALARARRRRRLVPVEGGDRAPEGGSPLTLDANAPADRAAESRELGQALRAALDTLPDSLRAVFVLREVEGLSAQETAEALEITPENARVRLHRAKAALRRELDARIGREVRRLYLFDGLRCDRTVASVLERLGLA